MSLKKGRIRPVKRMPGIDHAQEYEEGFEILSNAITVIFKKQARELSYELLYRTAYKLTIRQFGERLYHDVEKVIADYLETIAEQVIVPAFVNSSNETSTADAGASFLKTVKKVWDDYTTAIDLILQVLYYLNERLPKYNLPSVYDMGLNLFRDKVVRSQKYPIQKHLISAMLTQIQLERNGDVIDRSALQSAVAMLAELTDPETNNTVYVVDFEVDYLETSTSFYQIESQKLVSSYDAPEFMRKVEKRLEEEYERTVHCLSMGTETKIRTIVETQLIANNLKTLMEMQNSGLESMLTADKYGDLSRMYGLFSRVPAGLNEMRGFISDYILTMGGEINQQTMTDLKSKTTEKSSGSIAINWVLDVLRLQDKFDKILDQAANKDKTFQTVFNEAFEKFINENQKSAEFISLFIDENLKKGLKGKSEDEIDDVLDKTITLFRFLQDKDIFERYYKQHLAKRLLFNRSVSDDAERNMLLKLKRECGYQFTTKLEGMFNDMKLSLEMNALFKDYIAKSTNDDDKLTFDTSVTVLTSTFWPMNISASPKCVLPSNIINACKAFERFYFDRHNGRTLSWQPQMGTSDIRAYFKKSKHLLNVPTYALVVLLLFNTHDTLRWDEIKLQTQIADNDLKRTLQSLACAKYKILTKSSKGRDILPDDTFTFNENFTSNLARIRIQALSSKVESEGERKHTQDKVDEERKHQVEAAIVRIMKDRKTMEHNLLIAEVTKQLSSRFMPSPVMIKKRIEALIDREYLERSTEDRRSYHYLA
ncbi:Cullin [Cokeromyces recurvatus]|uniref:Cullin n=1 Tax=Cokeromyces recurvatus TaxID=90255 RepID=UPI00221EDEDD|nr:Cullin [Cokeromyces recurvatus]KAI7908004.1 Cullin [Cokeromyces recurvatus]